MGITNQSELIRKEIEKMKKTIIFGFLLIGILVVSGCAQQSVQPISQPTQNPTLNTSDMQFNIRWNQNSPPCSFFERPDKIYLDIEQQSNFKDFSEIRDYGVQYGYDYCCTRKLDGYDVGFGGEPGRHGGIVGGSGPYVPIGRPSVVFEDHAVEICCYLCKTNNQPESNEVCVEKTLSKKCN